MSTRDDILKAAISFFSTYGFHKTTMSDIGNRVGINKASLYYHYKDKVALYEAVIQHMRADHMITANKQIDQENTIENKIICFIKCELDFFSKIAISYIQGPIPHDDESKNASLFIIEEDIKIISKMLQKGIRNDFFESCNTEELARQLIQVVHGLLLLNCPLNLPNEEKKAGYEFAKNESENIIRLILKGIKK